MKGTEALFLFVLLVSSFTGTLAVAEISGASTRIVYLPENSPEGTTVLTLVAVNPDGDMLNFKPEDINPLPGAQYYFRTIQSGNTGLVVVNGTGDHTPDRETTPIVTFAVVLGNVTVAEIDRVSVTVILQDVNDNDPVWPSYNQPPTSPAVTISEFSAFGTVVYAFLATDADIPNNQVRYYLESPIDGTFSVGELSGLLILDSTPDPGNISVSVRVQDEGIPSRSIILGPIIILVIDVPDPAPVFTQSLYSVTLEEGNYTSFQSVLVEVLARIFTDSTATIRYTQVETNGPTDDLFSIDPTMSSGTAGSDVSAVGDIDYEVYTRLSFNIEAVKVDPLTFEVLSFPAIATVAVTLLDINDNTPTFITNHYIGDVSELADNGTVVITIVDAFDLDEGINNVFEYSLASGQECETFAIDPITARITLCDATVLDYETVTSYDFMIIAVETLTPMGERRTGSATVIISVENENDNLPFFVFDTYTFEVKEGQAAGPLSSSNPSGLMTIEAEDADLGIFGDLTYDLSGSGSSTSIEVDSTDGTIRTVVALDREDREQYHLTLIAEDGGTNPHRAFTNIIINVLDINDENPTFNPTMYAVTLREDMSYDNFLTVIATDDDEPGSINSMIDYSLERVDQTSNLTGIFSINSNGHLNAFNLNHEVDRFYRLRIIATDRGTDPGPLTGNAFVDITILDANEHVPVFVSPSYTAVIDETLAAGGQIGVTVSATDLDNHNITYSIATTTDGSFFSVDARSGVVTLAHLVDYEDPLERTLTFTVVATDNGSPMLTGSAQVMVTVNDVNDNTPVITNPPDHDGFQYTILEEVASIPAMLLRVEAVDDDGDSDGELVYNLTASTGITAFTIGSNLTGEVQQVEQLNREDHASHVLTIEVCDQGATPKCSSVDLTITVEDYNDNPPVFNTPLASPVTISECSPGGSSVTQVTAVDLLDEPGINTAVLYSFVAGGDTAKFLVESSGKIYLNEDGVDYEDPADRNLSVTIQATDTGTPPQTSASSVTLNVVVTDCNDNPPVFNMSSYEVIINESQAATTMRETILDSIDTTDEDGTAADRAVTYMIVTAAGIPDWFDVDSTSGDLYIKTGETVDRESNMITRDSTGRGIVLFGIQAINNKAAADPGEDFTTTVPVEVIITDINDNTPVFADQSGMVSVMVAENSPMNTLLTVLSATDADFDQLNSEIFFSITAGNDDGKFDLKTDGDLASVILVGNVDRENTSSYTITVTAENNVTLSDGTPSTSTINVQITVTSTNDRTPMFDKIRYTATINEYNNLTMVGVMPNSSVHFPDPPTATDGDGDQLEYFITGGNDDLGIFGIPDKTQAIVRVIQPDLIDHETTKEYDIIVTVRDTVVPVRQNTTHVVITVIDLNDNFPYFLDAEYTGTIVEEEPGNTQVLVTPTLRVADPDDLDGENELEVTLIDSNPQPQNFRVSQDGSIVNATTSLDREDEDSFIITVQVQDSATNRVTTTLRITVSDVNDNAPIIQETEMELAVKLPEDFPIGDPVQTVTARDDDIGENADFQWHLTGGNGQFDIDRITGVISLNQLLDIEDITEYELNVTASDIVHQTHIIVMVTVVNDTNDNDPRFIQSVYEGEIEENAVNQTRVRIKGTLASDGMFLTVNATDRDLTSDVEYELEPGTTAPFAVDRNSGEIYVAGALDREMPNGFFYSFTILGVDTVMGSTPDTTIIEIVIVDVNDESPMFSTSEYMVSVQEGTPANLTVLEVSAVDADIGNNSQIVYLIDSVNPPSETGYFGLDPVTGDVFPTREVAIDSATDPTEITLEIIARDKGAFPREDTARVILHLIDINDEAPEFNETNYEFQIRENVDGRVGTVYAVDRDISSANTNITYSIRSGEGSSRFSINELTGEISTVGTLDREDRALYTLTISAQDNPTTGMPRSAFATVNVDILDENDNDPDFDPDSYLIRISELSIINSTVVQLLAFDMDETDTPNSQLTFTLAGDTFAFKVDATDGTIRTKQTFDYEDVKEYYLVATVRDNGTPQRSDMANITVRMVDENDNSPMFVHPSTVEVDVFEELPSDTLIFTVNATDRDDGLNKELAYTFGDNSQTKGPFRIDRINGEVRTTTVLDRETEDKYELTVFVSDQNGVGVAVRHTAGTLTVNVLDINDGLPYFTEDPRTIRIPEDQAFSSAGVVVGDAPEAGDNDIGVNAVIYYHILTGTGGTDCIFEFCINPSNGEIRVVAEVDRETRPEYSIDVVVSNNPVWNETARLEGLRTVIITVEDINDSPPVFINETLLAAVAEEADFATTVTTLRTTDGDLGNGSVSHFEFLTSGVPFVVDEDTGVVTTAGVFNGQSGTKYEIRVRAFDNLGNPPSLSTSNVMTVFVFKTTEQIIATFGKPKEEIDAKADRIEQVLAEVTGSRIIINEIQVHETASGGVDTTATDVIFFALDPITGNVLEPNAVIEIIDDEYEPGTELYALFEECDLQSIIPHPGASSGSDDIPDYVWPIVALLIFFLLFVCCCLLCVFIAERRRNRKLKKRQELSSYQSELDQFRSQMEYAQVSNPLWVSPYDNWEETTTASGTQLEADNPLYESQELTIEMFQDDDDEDVLVSRENLVKPPPLSHSTPTGQQRESNYSGANDDELLAEAIGERKYYDFDSETSLI